MHRKAPKSRDKHLSGRGCRSNTGWPQDRALITLRSRQYGMRSFGSSPAVATISQCDRHIALDPDRRETGAARNLEPWHLSLCRPGRIGTRCGCRDVRQECREQADERRRRPLPVTQGASSSGSVTRHAIGRHRDCDTRPLESSPTSMAALVVPVHRSAESS